MIEKVRPKLPCAYQLQDVGDTINFTCSANEGVPRGTELHLTK